MYKYMFIFVNGDWLKVLNIVIIIIKGFFVDF